MSQVKETAIAEDSRAARFRDWFADHLGVRSERKEEIYIGLSQSASIRDASYWLQILFAAGIATLGLVLNSPAVIIGAMLISPLMGPILAGGLALATGDLTLGLRTVGCLLLSCVVAVSFAVLLVSLLPFKEMTSEIAGRTQPTTLDLFVALFSGAIGSVATCKEVKGVVTSIPGVAIAVALMPPLCVVGYGIGVAFSSNGTEGMRVAQGGGLLFLTNLVAITFTAMIVFLILHIDTVTVKQRVEEWRQQDPESRWVRAIFARLHVSEGVRTITSLPGRLLMIFIPIIVILVPLSQSFSQLKREIAKQQQENRLRAAATDLWQQSFGRLPNGDPRSYLDRLTVAEQDSRLNLSLRIFTSKPYSSAEKTEYTRLLAARLNKPVESVGLQLIEIPTASGELATKAAENSRLEVPPTVAKLQANFLQGVETGLAGLRLPPAAQLVTYKLISSADRPLQLVVTYLGDRDIEADAQALITDDIRTRLGEPAAAVRFERVPATADKILFARNQAVISSAAAKLLDLAGQTLRDQPRLALGLIGNAEKGEPPEIAQARLEVVIDYLTAKGQLSADRLASTTGTAAERSTLLKYQLISAQP